MGLSVMARLFSHRSPLRHKTQVIGSRFIRRATATVHDRQTLPEDILRSVDVRVFRVAATRADETRLALTASFVDCATRGTGLRCVSGVDFNKRPTTLFQFVGKHRFNTVPTDVQNGPVESALLGNASSPSAPRHVASFQIFDHDRSIVARDFSCCFMLPVTTNARGLGLQARHNLALLSVSLRPSLAARENALRLASLTVNFGQVSGAVFSAIRCGYRKRDTTVNTNSRQRTFRRFVFAANTNAGEPLAALQDYSHTTHLAYQIASVAILHPPHFRHFDLRPFAVETLNSGFSGLDLKALIQARFSELRKAAAPKEVREAFVQIGKRRMLEAGRCCSNPIDFRAKLRQLPPLRNSIQRLAGGAPVLSPKVAALLKREIVNEAHTTCEFRQNGGLFSRGIEPVFLSAKHFTLLADFLSKPKALQ